MTKKLPLFRDGKVKTTAVWVNSQFILRFAVTTEENDNSYLVPSGMTNFKVHQWLLMVVKRIFLSALLLVSAAPQ